jgi:hypothetical protein
MGFLDAGGEKRLAVGSKVSAKLRDFFFALVDRFAHPCVLPPL